MGPRTASAGPRLPIVGVMGSGADEHPERSEPLGRWLAATGANLLTGGGAGVMAAVSRAFHAVPGRVGSVIGVIPGDSPADVGRESLRAGYPNPWVEIAIRTHLPLSGERGTEAMSRNHINVLSSDVIVALPGGAGTRSEVELAVSYGRPIVAFLASKEGIPALPEGVPLANELSEVQTFVRAALGAYSGRSSTIR